MKVCGVWRPHCPVEQQTPCPPAVSSNKTRAVIDLTTSPRDSRGISRRGGIELSSSHFQRIVQENSQQQFCLEIPLLSLSPPHHLMSSVHHGRPQSSPLTTTTDQSRVMSSFREPHTISHFVKIVYLKIFSQSQS